MKFSNIRNPIKNNDVKSASISASLLIQSYDDYAIICALFRSKKYFKWLLTFHCSIYFPREKLESPDTKMSHVRLSPQPYFPVLENLGLCEYRIDVSLIKEKRASNKIVSLLDEGCVIRLILDIGMFECSKKIGLSRTHVSTIVGYNQVQSTFDVLGWFGGDYVIKSVNFSILEQSFKNVSADEQRVEIISIIAETLTSDDMHLDENYLIPQLKAFIKKESPEEALNCVFSKLGTQDKFDGMRYIAKQHERSLCTESIAWGTEVNRCFIHYIDQCLARGDQIDVRATRVFWEHKNLMQIRLKKLLSQKAMIKNSRILLKNYSSVVDTAFEFRIASFESVINAPKKSFSPILFNLGNLNKIRDQEDDIINDVISILTT